MKHHTQELVTSGSFLRKTPRKKNGHKIARKRTDALSCAHLFLPFSIFSTSPRRNQYTFLISNLQERPAPFEHASSLTQNECLLLAPLPPGAKPHKRDRRARSAASPRLTDDLKRRPDIFWRDGQIWQSHHGRLLTKNRQIGLLSANSA